MAGQEPQSLAPKKTLEKNRRKEETAKKAKQIPPPVYFYIDRQGTRNGKPRSPPKNEQKIVAEAIGEVPFCVDRKRENALQGSQHDGKTKKEGVKVPAPAQFSVDAKDEMKLNGVQSVPCAKNEVSLVPMLVPPVEDGLGNCEQKVGESSVALGNSAALAVNEPESISKSKKKKKDKDEKKKKVKSEKKEAEAGEKEDKVEKKDKVKKKKSKPEQKEEKAEEQKEKAAKKAKADKKEDEAEVKKEYVEKKKDTAGKKKDKAKKKKSGSVSANFVTVKAEGTAMPAKDSTSVEHLVLDDPLFFSGDCSHDYLTPFGKADGDEDSFCASDHDDAFDKEHEEACDENGAAESAKNVEKCGETGVAESGKNGFSDEKRRRVLARKRALEVSGEYWSWEAAPTAADCKAVRRLIRENKRVKWKCELCLVTCSGGIRIDEHIASRKHQTKENLQAVHAILPTRNNRLPPDDIERKKAEEESQKKLKGKLKSPKKMEKTGKSRKGVENTQKSPKRMVKTKKMIMMERAYEKACKLRLAREKEIGKSPKQKNTQKSPKKMIIMETEYEKACRLRLATERKEMIEISRGLWCSTCQCSFISNTSFEDHKQSTRHISLEGKLSTCIDEIAE